MLLAPYRVLDLTNERGLLCGRILADLGADVIAVEPPGGSSARRIGPFVSNWGTRAVPPVASAPSPPDGGSAPGTPDDHDPENSLFWWAFSRDKRGITLDIETDAGREHLRRLVQGADFLIESFDPGYLDRLGLGYAALSELNPRLVMVSITPFGSTGPKAHWAATDLTAWAASGALLLTGDEDRPPVRVPGEQAWLHAGSEAAVAALVAHAARERDGVGQHVDVSAQTAAMLAALTTILQAGWNERPLGRVGGGVKAGPLHIRLVYACTDGYVSVSFYFGSAMGPFTRRLFEWMHEEGFVDAATRDKDWVSYAALLLSGQEPLSEFERCTAAIERFTSSKTKAELFEGALQRGLLVVPVSTTADLAHAEQFQARDYWTPVEHEDLDRPVVYPGPFAKFSATPIRYRRRAPRIGEHNADLTPPTPLPSQGRGEAHSTAVGLGTPFPAREGGRGVRSADSELPLAGLNVLDLSWVLVGPMGIRYLADYGATVVRVESGTRVDTLRTLLPFKDGQPGTERSAPYATTNAGKLGITLNLARPEARELALRLVRWADVVAESYSPKAMRAWGLHYEALREVNPGLIMLSTCLNGQTGPHAPLAGYGSMGSALAGFHGVTGWPDRLPAGPFSAYTDAVSPKFIASAILAALDHRRRTGQGQYIDLAQVEASVHFLGPAVLDSMVNGRVQTRAGNDCAEQAPYGVYPALGEDRWVAIACATEAQWVALCAATDHAEWQADPRFATFGARRANRAALDAALAAWTAPREVGVIEQTLQAADVPVHRVSSSADAFADPQLHHRGHFVTVEHPELGAVSVEGARARLSRTPARISGPGPTYGQHNEQVLREILGMSEEEVAALVASGALE